MLKGVLRDHLVDAPSIVNSFHPRVYCERNVKFENLEEEKNCCNISGSECRYTIGLQYLVCICSYRWFKQCNVQWMNKYFWHPHFWFKESHSLLTTILFDLEVVYLFTPKPNFRCFQSIKTHYSAVLFILK